METLLAVLAVLAVGWFALWLLIRRALRAARRRIAATGDRAMLVARAYGVGPASQVARVRRDMARALTGVRRALAAAQLVQTPVGDVPSLLARLELAAHAVDGELRVLEAQPDRAGDDVRLDGPRSRAQVIIASAAQLGDGLLHAAGQHAEELSLLRAACEIEADALRSAQAPGGLSNGAGSLHRPAQI